MTERGRDPALAGKKSRGSQSNKEKGRERDNQDKMGLACASLHNEKKLSTTHVDIDKTCN
eukprot:scaffold126113_cov40-Attheya_sp.AAC.1